ncbi:MAG: hypothetical protein P3A58_06660 [Gemmatimonadota bacterium]|nr:hypothetical protein [Gemmatimonadota bacterium]MDQ8177031.1 hypothetical protein [Gemmatimonadota bacterium]
MTRFSLTPIRELLARLVAGLCLITAPASAQFASTPEAEWMTITTPHFRIYHPKELGDWARDVAGRMEGIRTAVGEMVGYTPPQVIEIIVEDPVNQTNGSALPLQRGPTIRLWPIPPAPGQLGHYREWGELVAVHEYAHLAHLLRPTRIPDKRLIEAFLPIVVSPIVENAPAWIFEGYATVIEGRLTGSGRPNGVFRPAILRQLALEGKLPSYDALDDVTPFLGGAMRYLVGSAFLEWLADRDGWATHQQLWRRMTARTERSFEEAFRGLYGENPDRLYGRFVAEVTAKAAAADRVMQGAGEVRGTLFQQLDWFTGAPSVSPDGKRVAVERVQPGKAPRIVVWSMEPKVDKDSVSRAKRDSTAVAGADSAGGATGRLGRANGARRRAAKVDSLDVPDRPFLPAPREEMAVLVPQGGAGWEEPRFLSDGRHLTVIRSEVLADGRSTPDLWVWDADSGDVRRVTRGAAIRAADPFPDGMRAAGVRCLAGRCDLVLIDLTTGQVTPLARGGFDANYSGVRVSPDGLWVASARQADGRWEVVRVEVATGALRPLLPRDEASRYEPTWLPDGSGLIVVSEATGTPQLERIALDGTATPLTRFAGLTSLPEVSRDGRTFFLAMHARGWDLRTIRLDSAAAPARVVLADSLAPVAPRQRIAEAKAFPTSAIGSLPYGIGRLGATWLPNVNISAEGQDRGGALVVSDAVGRLGAVLQGGYGERAVWRGGSLAVTWRGLRPSVGVQAFAARHLPSQQEYEPLLDGSFDAEYRGIAVVTERTHPGTTGTVSWRAAASQGSLQGRAAPCITCLASWAPIPAGARAVVAGQLAASRTFTPRGRVRIAPSVSADLAAGRTDGTAWRRAQVQGGLRVGGWAGGGLELSAQYGQVTADAPGYERFALGGAVSPYVDPLLLQGRWEAPGQAFGALTGTRAFRARVSLAGAFVQVDHAGIGEIGPGRRLVGFETLIATPAVPAARFPAFRAKAGIAMPLDGPRRRDAVFYTTLVLTP